MKFYRWHTSLFRFFPNHAEFKITHTEIDTEDGSKWVTLMWTSIFFGGCVCSICSFFVSWFFEAKIKRNRRTDLFFTWRRFQIAPISNWAVKTITITMTSIKQINTRNESIEEIKRHSKIKQCVVIICRFIQSNWILLWMDIWNWLNGSTSTSSSCVFVCLMITSLLFVHVCAFAFSLVRTYTNVWLTSVLLLLNSKWSYSNIEFMGLFFGFKKITKYRRIENDDDNDNNRSQNFIDLHSVYMHIH